MATSHPVIILSDHRILPFIGFYVLYLHLWRYWLFVFASFTADSYHHICAWVKVKEPTSKHAENARTTRHAVTRQRLADDGYTFIIPRRPLLTSDENNLSPFSCGTRTSVAPLQRQDAGNSPSFLTTRSQVLCFAASWLVWVVFTRIKSSINFLRAGFVCLFLL